VASVGNNAAQPSESSPPYNDTRVQGSRPHENQWDGAEDLGVLDPNEDLRDTLVRSPIVIPELNEPSGFAAGAGDPALASEFQVIDDLEIAIGESSSWPTADLLPADASGLHLDDVFEDMGTAAGHNAFITFDPVSDAWGVDPKNHRDDVENAAKKSGSSSRFDNEFRPRGDFAESDEDGRPMLADDEQWDHTPVAQHGLFARLWGVVRGLGASGWRNSDFHDSNANRRN